MLKEIRELEEKLNINGLKMGDLPHNSHDRVVYLKAYLLALRETDRDMELLKKHDSVSRS